MRWLTLASASLLAACGAAEVQSKKLNDGSLQITCELSMDECIRRVQDQCKNQRYRILEGTSETRLRDAPPFEHAYHTSRLHLTCTDDGADVLLSVGGKDTPAPEPKPAAKPIARLCTTGQTRECVGVAACKGGQTCLADGSGFGACDCGPSPTPAAPSSDPGAASPTTPVPPSAGPVAPTPSSP